MHPNSFGSGEVSALGANPAWHIAAHHAAFSTSAFCKSAIDFAEAADAKLGSWRRGANGGVWTLCATPASHLATHHAAFSASAFCKVQLISRRLLYVPTPLSTPQHTMQILSKFFGDCVLRTAIPFARGNLFAM